MEWWNLGMMGLKKTKLKAHFLPWFSYFNGMSYRAKTVKI
jgi:hypothetical protein